MHKYLEILREFFPLLAASLVPRVPGSGFVRGKFLNLAGCRVGKGVTVNSGFLILPMGKCGNLSVGNGTFINTNLRVGCGASVQIGEKCSIGPSVMLETANHSLDILGTSGRSTEFEMIIIEDHVWIGAGSIILPGIRVGRRSVVAAGSVVTSDVPENVVYGGVPARKIKDLELP